MQTVAIVATASRLDSTSTPQFEKEMKDQIDAGATQIVCDLSACEYVASTALRVILATARALSRQGGGLALCCARQYVMEVLEIAGFTTILHVYDSVDGAVASLAGTGGSTQ
jgi:anti-sigma B factor antagonist